MEFIRDLKKYVVVVPRKKTNIDNFVFKLQYIGLKWILILCALISMRNYFGDWINCVTETAIQDVVNKFCFFTGTYTFRNGSVKGLFNRGGRNEIMYHKYYQWVPHFLFLQSLMFMFNGEILWRYYEDDTIYELLKNLRFTELTINSDEDNEKDKMESKNGNCKENKRDRKKDSSKKTKETFQLKKDNYTLDTKKSREVKIACIAQVLKQRMEHNLNRKWTVSLILCEVINFVNIFVQIYLTDIFIENRFLTLGFYSANQLKEAFPLMSKCLFYKYGSSGSIQIHDSLCILSMNILNEKIFIILWIAYVCVAILALANVILRIVQFLFYKKQWFTGLMCGPPVPPGKITWACGLNYSDWLFLKYLAKNLSPAIFHTIIKNVATTTNFEIDED